MNELMGYREIVEKDGMDLDEIFYVSSFVRLYEWSTLSGTIGYTVRGQQSGNGYDYFNQSFSDLDEAQKVYDTLKGVLAHSKTATEVTR